MEWWYVPRRYIVVLLAHVSSFIMYALRVDMDVAMRVMVNSTESSKDNLFANVWNGTNTTINDNGEFDWDLNKQELVLNSFYYGHLTTQLPAAWLANTYGGKHVLGVAIIVTSVLSLLTPVVARTSVYLLIALRVLVGISEGVTGPSVHALIARWSPPKERTKMASFSYAGISTATIITVPICRLLVNSNFLRGWPSPFYVFGTFGIIWAIIWITCLHITPKDHPTISNIEKTYITQSQNQCVTNTKDTPIPWLQMFTSIRVWAIIVAHFSHNWLWYSILYAVPSYFKDVLNFSLIKNEVYVALPFIVGFVIIILGSTVADLLIKRCATVTHTRKLMAVIGFYPSAVLLVLLTYLPSNEFNLSVTCLVLLTGCLCFNSSSYLVNHLDIAPRFAGVLYGITNTAGTIAAIISPIVTSYFTGENPTRKNYHDLFLITALVGIFGGAFFICFLSGEQQKWNHHESDIKVVEGEINQGMEPDDTTVQTDPRNSFYGLTKYL